MSYVYLASPYSDKFAHIRQVRYLRTLDYVAKLLAKEVVLFSPIVHCHEMAKIFDLPKDIEFWRKYDYAMIDQASALHILCLPGLNKSIGVLIEAQYAHGLKLPIVFVTPLDGLDVEDASAKLQKLAA